MTIRSMPSNQNYRDNFDRVFGKKTEEKSPYPEICGSCHYRGELDAYSWCSLLAVRLDRIFGIDRECAKYRKKATHAH